MESLQLPKGHYLSNLISGFIQNINYRFKKKSMYLGPRVESSYISLAGWARMALTLTTNITQTQLSFIMCNDFL